MPPQGRLYFVHLPKTAGSTLRPVIARQYWPAQVLNLRQEQLEMQLRSLKPVQHQNARLLSGHFFYGLHTRFDGPYTYATILRHPISRLISSYHYNQHKPNLAHHDFVHQHSIVEFARDRGAANLMTRYLAGVPDGEPITEAHCQQALSNLQNSFTFIGLTEHFDESLLLMKHIYGFGPVYYARRNTSDQLNIKKEPLSPDQRAELEALSQYDMRLYAFATDWFAAQKAAYGAQALPRDLDLFQRENQRWGTWYTRWDSLRQFNLKASIKSALYRR
jgi:hypothetical protein